MRLRTRPGSRAPRHRCAGRASASLLLAGEHVAGAAHGEDAARLLRIVLDRRADPRDVDVDRAIEGLERLALDEIHQRIPRHHAAGVLGERDEKRELMTGERLVLAVEARDASVTIDLEPAEAEDGR